MGASMTGIIEWTHDAQCANRPDTGLTLGDPRRQDDFVHGVLFQTDKEYDFFAAVAGVRNRFDKPPLIPPRGVPPNTSVPTGHYFDRNGDEGIAGWLHLSEIDLCVEHMSDVPFYTGFEIDMALQFMRLLVARLTDVHVRLVFNIEG